MSERKTTVIPSYDQYDISGEAIVACEPRPKHEHPVFARIAELDALARQQRLNGADEAGVRATRLATEARQLLKKQHLLKKQVIAHGPDIRLPEISVDVQNGGIEFVEGAVAEGDIEGAFAASNVIGPLRSVTGKVEPASYDDNGLPVDWCVSLEYLIVSDIQIQPHGMLELYARAPVASTVMEYSDDNRLRVLRAALDRLLSIESLEVVEEVSELNTLASSKEQSGASMTRIGELVRDLYGRSDLTEQQRDALFDIVEYNLFDPYMHDVKAQGVYKVDAQGVPGRIEGGEQNLFGYTGRFDEIIVVPGFATNEDDLDAAIRTDEFEAFFTATIDDDVYYFPLLGMRRFETNR